MKNAEERQMKSVCEDFKCFKIINSFKRIVWYLGKFAALYFVLRAKWDDQCHSHVGVLNVEVEPEGN